MGNGPADDTLTCEQGSSWAHGWQVTYNGVPVDSTWTVTTAVVKKDFGGDVIANFSASVSDAGAVVIGLNPSDSAPFKFTEGYYLVKVTNGSVTLRVAQGRFLLDKEA